MTDVGQEPGETTGGGWWVRVGSARAVPAAS